MERESSSGRKGGRGRGQQRVNRTTSLASGSGPEDSKKASSSSSSNLPTNGNRLAIDSVPAPPSRSRPTNGGRQSSNKTKPADEPPYPPYLSLEECLRLYNGDVGATVVVRGKLRVPSRDGLAFVSCDRGRFERDVILPTVRERNRALDGDQVLVLLDPPDEEEEGAAEEGEGEAQNAPVAAPAECAGDLHSEHGDDREAGDWIRLHAVPGISEDTQECMTWQDDRRQMQLWNPIVTGIPLYTTPQERDAYVKPTQQQRTGRVIYVYPPKALESELPTDSQTPPTIPNRRIVGNIQQLVSGTLLFNPQRRNLPQFKCPASTVQLLERLLAEHNEGAENPLTNVADLLCNTLFQAEYVPMSWQETHKWPPCRNVRKVGSALVLEDEIQALLISADVDDAEFAPSVLQCVDEAVRSGLYDAGGGDNGEGGELGWKPTPDMLLGRRDFRNERIFTIDPTTAKDLDDALHIKRLPPSVASSRDDVVEVGVHIADVSFFVRPGTPVDQEAQNRSTTVYLVDRTIPMLPRPLCEIACSLNENVERLAFSCVWRMRLDGTLVPGPDSVWYGRSVIRSCARLDYATAQNIIENKVATGEANVDDALWPPARRPTAPHTIDQVAVDVRLMHLVAMARRRTRFESGALALHSTKLTFQLDSDGQAPLLVAPYPIRDSNRLVEEYMLLANYLVAQRLLTHAKTMAVLRMHPPPLMSGMDSVVNVAAAAGIEMDVSTSQTLHESLVSLSRQGDPLLLQCVTSLLMNPMRAAEYFVVGCNPEPKDWRHYALNIPYYTHFTSPIRRYPDVMVHRLLQATIDGPHALRDFPMPENFMETLCQHSNDRRLLAKDAQERCDRVYLSLYVREHPMAAQLGVVLSVGTTSFTVFLPSLGTSAMLYLAEHAEMLTYATDESDGEGGSRRLLLQRKPSFTFPPSPAATPWTTLEVRVLVKLAVSVVFKDRPPIDIKARLEGPWRE